MQEEKEEIEMIKLDSSVYDFLKKFVIVWMPAMVTCFSVIANALNADMGCNIPVSTIVTIVTAVQTCLGVMLGVSSKNYYKGLKNE